MKRNKQITIDEEIFDYLKTKENASGVINKLLKDWMNDQELDNYTKEQLLAERDIIELKEEFDKKSREIRENARTQ